MSRTDDLRRIESALERSRDVLREFTPGNIAHRIKEAGDPVTAADTAVNDMLLETLPTGNDGWLSEETVDDPARLDRERVWIVDPVDGTKEFVAGIPEWCVSVGLVENGRPVAGGILNPTADLLILGSVETGVTANGEPCRTSERTSLHGAEVLASRSEVGRGEWKRFEHSGFRPKVMGSVAWKMALVAAGRTDATWTLVPKNEWDVAAGTALVLAAGGRVWIPGGEQPGFNRPKTRLPGLCAAPAALEEEIRSLHQKQPEGRQV